MRCFKRINFGTAGMIARVSVCGTMVLYGGTVLAGPKGAVGDLYVSDANNNRIVQIDSATGEIVGDFAINLPGLPFDARFGPNGNLFIVELDSGTVTEHDGNTGALIGTFISGLDVPCGLRFEANGNLLIYEAGAGNITEFDSAGNPLGIFASGLGGDDAPMDFGPDGNLYMSYWSRGVIRRFAPDGTDMGNFTKFGSAPGAESHVFGPNGNLFVSCFFVNKVKEFDGITGDLIGNFISTNLDSPTGLVFGPDGNAWVSNWGEYGAGTDINEFNGKTGEWMRQVTGFTGPLSITVKPVSGPTDCLTMTVSALTGGENASWDISGTTAGSVVAVVYGLQAGSTVVTDQMGFCATFGINGVSLSSLVGTAVADGSGNASITKMIPDIASGLTVLTQAAEQGTCPNECVSNLDTQVVQ